MPLNNPTPTEQLTALREGILAKFNLEELRTLVFDLNVNYDDLRGDTISAKIQALVEHLEKRDRISDLLTLLKQRRPNEKWDSFVPSQPDAQSPYKGLQFFTAADADLFFGREQLTAELIDHLRAHRFLAVVGASGSGKSSVVRAGVIPRIKSGALAEDGLSSDTWQVHIITPTEHPLQNLANSLTRDSESVTAAITLADDLQQDSRSLDLYVSRQLAGESHGHILLVVDQFEELFTQCDDLEESRLFVENLVTAVTSGMPGRLRLILTLRADFYAYAVQHESLRPLLETRQKIVGAMNQAELRQAIDSPAQATGWRLQPGLIDTILQAVGREPGALPLLSHALQETWERREGRVMTLAGYQAAGGVRQAIAQTADTVYSQLTPKEQSIARNIFLRLTELGEGREDTRRRAALTELLPQDEKETAVRDVLYLLTQKRLVTLNEERTEENTSQNYAEVAHEALIREWPTLRKWLDENREGLRIHRQLTAVVKEWQAAEEDPSYLYQGIRLARAMDWAAEHTNNLNLLESRFLQTSKEREVNEQARIAAIATERTRASRFLNIALLVANIFAIAFLIILLQNRANLATAVAQAQTLQSQALAASAQSVRGNNDMQALLLAIASAQTADTAMALETLNHQLSLMTKPVQTYVHGSSVGGARWNRDESHLL
ncbi:MAG: hypothetical protein KC441_18930, partial [Anaerolineales bacterium]|nr:hypothetical protein [Anaerolineales bacterium]